jgi:class 3 adenylate cyclase
VKTKEGIFLERLASQFSPQVIRAIKTGTLNIDERLRAQVAVIFIDVQNSTVHSMRIDHHNYAALMSDFFSDCVKILLKHNVTIGTFQGDGIMAFTNAPVVDPKFKENAIRACLDIVRFHQRVKDAYVAKWRTDFNIRIGIEVGWSTVGFFPSREYGTYTALGSTANLAARLCSRAPLNSIAVTNNLLVDLKIEDGLIRVERRGLIDLKGIEGEKFEVFSLSPTRIGPELPEGICPGCELGLEIISRQIGAGIGRCPKCGYRQVCSLVA